MLISVLDTECQVHALIVATPTYLTPPISVLSQAPTIVEIEGVYSRALTGAYLVHYNTWKGMLNLAEAER